MGLSQLMLFAFTVSLFHFSHSSVCHDDEAFALLQFNQSLTIDKDSCPFEYSKLVSWNLDGENSTDCCSWDGVVCDNYTGHVVELDLSSSCLHGSINSSSTLFQLVHLEWLSLAANNFSYSHIPNGIMNLSKLSYLDLSFSYFYGQIPSEMLELSQLEYLDLSWNSLGLRRQPSLRNLVEKLTNLKWLDLSYVNISSPIPNSLANLSSLTYLSLHDCQLQGMIPSSIGNLTKLVHLHIYDNNIVGELPISVGNLASLQVLDVSVNQLSLSQAISPLGNLAQLTALDLCYNNFSSQALLSSLGNLTQLSYLSLSHVNFAGEIPFWLVNLKNLTDLNMSENQLTGSIPYWLMNLNLLSTLDLGSNHLTGQIPYQIMDLTQLIYLDFSSNRLQGPIPSSISELMNLQYLNLYSNNLNGKVELDMYLLKLKSLNVLILSSNNLWVLTKNTVNTTVQNFHSIGLGSCNLTVFPNFLKNQDELLGLDLSSNNISGQIPGWLLNISVGLLLSLNLSNNLLTGFDHHPVVLPWTNLVTLDIRSNKLQGSLPLPASSIKFYLASNNKLSGDIPQWICNLTQLFALDLSYNNLSGVLPQCLGNFSNYLSILGLQSNNFFGSIPQLFMRGSALRMINLSRNKLEGKVPRSLADCASLEFLNLGYNQITDTFPFWLGNLSELKVLILKSNRFYGMITEPKENFEFSKLHIIDLSRNLFTGELPSKYFQHWISMKVVNESQLTYLECKPPPFFFPFYVNFDFLSYAYAFVMDNKGIEIAYGKISNKLTSISLSGNEFTGEIPTSISNLRALKNLNLSNNNLFGCIPSSLSNLTELESLDLSNNKLSGKIPQELVALTPLAFINVSHNNLKGRIPQGYQFDTFEKRSYEGNPGLCGKPLLKPCENSKTSRRGEDGGSEWEYTFAFEWKIVLIGFVSGLIVGVVLGNEYFTNITEWFARIFWWQLIKVKRRRRGHRN